MSLTTSGQSRVTKSVWRTALSVCAAILPGFCVLPPAFCDELNLSEIPADVTTLVIMSPEGPVFAQVRLSVDGKPYRKWVSDFLASRMDINRDGRLTLTELGAVPARLLAQTSAATPEQALKLATGLKKPSAIPLRRFTLWFSNQLTNSVEIIAGASNASDSVRLASFLDRNKNESVEQEELTQASYALRFRDLDDDQTFSATELLPYRDPRVQQAAIAPDAAALPFIQITDSASVNVAAKRILQRYGRNQGLDRSQLRFPQSVTAELPETLSIDDIKALLPPGSHHLTMHVPLSDAPNRSYLFVEVAPGCDEFCHVQPGRRGQATLMVDDMRILIRARGGTVRDRGFLTNFILQYFSIADEDKNGYLSPEEFPALSQRFSQNGITAEFADADINRDNMLHRNELKMFIERDAIATQSHIEVSVRQNGETLFKILDTNSDRRLSPRELMYGYAVLQKFDLDGDGRISESELGTTYNIEIGLGQTDALRMDTMMMQNPGMQARSTDAILPALANLSGPEWFRRMDRNLDGDVSRREFTGLRETFAEIDTDQDGLLSATEAEVFTEMHAKSK